MSGNVLKDVLNIISQLLEKLTATPIPFVQSLFLLAAVLFLYLWFRKYVKGSQGQGRELDWVLSGPQSMFSIKPRGKLTKSDIAPMVCITLIYAGAALFYLGETTAPQSFWHAEPGDDTVMIDLGEPVTLDAVYYYTGNFHSGADNPPYELAFSEDGETFTLNTGMSQRHAETFSWRYLMLAQTQARYVRLTAKVYPMELGELCLLVREGAAGGRLITPVEVSPSGSALFDEQALFPAEGRTPVNSTYFDEIYHARSAYEYLTGVYPYEITHPPLGKEIISVGIKLFGMTPFGWRIMGTVFGILMLPLLYLLLKQLFNSTLVSTAATIIWAADFMHFTQTRIATIDTYNVFFVLLMFIFMHRWMTQPDDKPILYTLPPLFLCGLSFGLGAAAKWSSIYAGFGLVAMYVWKIIIRTKSAKENGRPYHSFIIATLACSVVFFLAVPSAIYLSSYYPLVTARALPVTVQNLWNVMADNQTYMFNYHSALQDTHPYEARWYLWILDARPICYYFATNPALLPSNAVATTQTANVVSVIDSFNNPLLSWGGFAAMVFCVIDGVKQKGYQTLFIVIGFLSAMLPWVLVTRITFAYHYFPATVFLVLALGYLFSNIEKTWPQKEAYRHIGLLTAACVLLFIMFYPSLSGVQVSQWYTKNVLQWLPSWPF